MITSRLRLVRLIGKGGMGTVWEAYHETLGTEVAVKLVDLAIARSNPAVVERFNREANIAAKLKNPHVAHTYDHGVLEDGTPYIVMELLEGESLHERIKRTGPLSLYETSLVVSQTAQALGKAHKKGIVHRDVKPGNLFCVETDYELFIKLLDFGIAKHVGGFNKVELTNTSNLLGSPLYMSPEQFTHAKGVDWRGDLWSLAVVAYRCLTGVPPFKGESIGQVIVAVMAGRYQRVTSLRPPLPVSLDNWFAKAFHPEIDERFQSAKALAMSFAEATRASVPDARGSLPSITELSRDSDVEQPRAELMNQARPNSSEVAAPERKWSNPMGSRPSEAGSPGRVAGDTITENLAKPVAEKTAANPNAAVRATPTDAEGGTDVADKNKTLRFTRPWRPAPSWGQTVTARLTEADVPQIAGVGEENVETITFAPASTTIGGSLEYKARWSLVAAAVLLLAVGGGATYTLMGNTPESDEAAIGTGAVSASGFVRDTTAEQAMQDEPPNARQGVSAVTKARAGIGATPAAPSSTGSSDITSEPNKTAAPASSHGSGHQPATGSHKKPAQRWKPPKSDDEDEPGF